ncbi:hypothetical protein LEMLEM_LOCUS27310, partial [Lemmus lemmus]
FVRIRASEGNTQRETKCAPPQVRVCEKRDGKRLSLRGEEKVMDKIAGLCPLPLKAQSVPKSGLQTGSC